MMKTKPKLKVFLDSNVIIQLIREKSGTLYDSIIKEQFNFFISKLIIQEVIFVVEDKKQNQIINNTLLKHLNVIDYWEEGKSKNKYRDLMKKITASMSNPIFRNTMVHSNEFINIVLANQNKCNYFLTNDKSILNLDKFDNMLFISIDQFNKIIQEG